MIAAEFEARCSPDICVAKLIASYMCRKRVLPSIYIFTQERIKNDLSFLSYMIERNRVIMSNLIVAALYVRLTGP